MILRLVYNFLKGVAIGLLGMGVAYLIWLAISTWGMWAIPIVMGILYTILIESNRS